MLGVNLSVVHLPIHYRLPLGVAVCQVSGNIRMFVCLMKWVILGLDLSCILWYYNNKGGIRGGINNNNTIRDPPFTNFIVDKKEVNIMIYDEWSVKTIIVNNRWHRLVIWVCERLTGMKVLALYRRK